MVRQAEAEAVAEERGSDTEVKYFRHCRPERHAVESRVNVYRATCVRAGKLFRFARNNFFPSYRRICLRALGHPFLRRVPPGNGAVTGVKSQFAYPR